MPRLKSFDDIDDKTVVFTSQDNQYQVLHKTGIQNCILYCFTYKLLTFFFCENYAGGLNSI